MRAVCYWAEMVARFLTNVVNGAPIWDERLFGEEV